MLPQKMPKAFDILRLKWRQNAPLDNITCVTNTVCPEKTWDSNISAITICNYNYRFSTPITS